MENNGVQELRDLGWCIVELMGHRRIAGQVKEDFLFGTVMMRLDIPTGEGFTTQFYGGSSIYAITPTTEEIARRVAAGLQPQPVQRWELLPPAGRDEFDQRDHDSDDDQEF